MDSAIEKTVTAVHAAPPKVVLEFAGAGSLALAWLHGVGGSSRTVLEATDRYAAASLVEAVGFTPQSFASPEVAEALAARAYARARRLAPAEPVAGVGCTAAIATDRTKRGEHRACVALRSVLGTTSYTLVLTKGLRTRGEEESVVSSLILAAVARACGVNAPALPLVEGERVKERFAPAEALRRLEVGEIDLLAVTPDGRLETGVKPGAAILSGSFNPLHEGHLELAEVASGVLGRHVLFELPLVNADKAPLKPTEAERRAAQFAGLATVVLTRAPLFSQKATLFPGGVFVVGADTAARLVRPEFYGGEAQMRRALGELRAAGCRFLVAGRHYDGRFTTLRDLELSAAPDGLFEEIAPLSFRRDVSSTQKRAEEASTS